MGSDGNDITCRVCTIRLEQLCYRRAWWFRAFREVLATGVRLFALVHRIKPDDFLTRAPGCHDCLRFKKNALKIQSPLFYWLDSWINPLFNRLRDSLLTAEELAQAKAFARQAQDSQFTGTSGDITCPSGGNAS